MMSESIDGRHNYLFESDEPDQALTIGNLEFACPSIPVIIILF
jgi:hypothetical protein